MTTVDHDTLDRDPDVLRDIGRRFRGRLALNANVARPGTIAIGDAVTLIRPPASVRGNAERYRDRNDERQSTVSPGLPSGTLPGGERTKKEPAATPAPMTSRPSEKKMSPATRPAR